MESQPTIHPAHLAQARHVGVGIADRGALGLQQFHQHEGRGFAAVVDVLFVGDAEHQDLGALEGLATIVEGVGDLADHPLGHGGVDLAGQFDEAGAEAVFARLPGEVEGVDGDAVAAEAGSGVVGGEAEGLGGGSADDFVDV